MSLDRESEAYVLAMTFLLRTPGAHVQRVICDPGCDVPRALEALLARWRNARDVCLPGELMRALADLDDNAAFNVLNTCVWRLLRGIVRQQELRRKRGRNGRLRVGRGPTNGKAAAAPENTALGIGSDTARPERKMTRDSLQDV